MTDTPTLTEKTIVKRTQKIVSSDLDGDTVMMSIDRGNYYGIDPIGSRIWELLAKPLAISVLLDTLTQEFDVNRDQCEQDTLRFLNELAAEKLLEIGEV